MKWALGRWDVLAANVAFQAPPLHQSAWGSQGDKKEKVIRHMKTENGHQLTTDKEGSTNPQNTHLKSLIKQPQFPLHAYLSPHHFGQPGGDLWFSCRLLFAWYLQQHIDNIFTNGLETISSLLFLNSIRGKVMLTTLAKDKQNSTYLWELIRRFFFLESVVASTAGTLRQLPSHPRERMKSPDPHSRKMTV